MEASCTPCKVILKTFEVFQYIIENSACQTLPLIVLLFFQNVLILSILLLSDHSLLSSYFSFERSFLNQFLIIPLIIQNYDNTVEIITLISISGYLFGTFIINLLVKLSEKVCYLSRLNNLFFSHALVIPFIGILIFFIYQNFGVNAVNCIASLLLLCIVVVYDLLVQLFMFDFKYHSQDTTGRNPKIIYYLKPILIIITFLSFMTDSYNSNSISFNMLILSLLILNLSQLYSTIVQFDYHNKTISKIKIALILFCISFQLWDGISYNFKSLTILSENYIVLSCVFYVFLLILALNYRNYTVKNLLVESIDNINDQYKFEMKMRTQYHLFFQSKQKKAELLSSAIIKSHNKQCKNVDCICKTRKQLYDPVEKEWGNENIQLHKDIVYIKHFIKMMFEQGLVKFRESKLIELSYLYFINTAFNLYQKIYLDLKIFESKFANGSINFCFKFLLFHLRKIIRNNLLNKNRTEGEFQIQNIKKFDQCFKDLSEKINFIAQSYYCLWKQLAESIVDKSNLLHICDDILDVKIKIEHLYEECLNYNDSSKLLLFTMYKYGSKISFDINIIKRIKKDITYVQQNYQNEALPASDIIKQQRSCMIKVSIDEESMAKIQWVSNSFKGIFLYQKIEIIGESLNKLMPDIYSRYHNQILHSWKQKGTQFNINKLSNMFAVDKTKTCFSCGILIKVIPTFDNFQLIAMISQRDSKDLILLEKDGVIIQSGSTLKKQILNLDNEFLNQHKIDFSLLCFGFNQHLKFSNQSLSSSTQRYINLLFPNNISNYLSQFHNKKKIIIEKIQNERINHEQEKQLKIESELNILIRNKMIDILFDFQKNISVWQIRMKIFKHSINLNKKLIHFFSVKIEDKQKLKEIPTFLKNLQEILRVETVPRIKNMKEHQKVIMESKNINTLFLNLCNEVRMKNKKIKNHKFLFKNYQSNVLFSNSVKKTILKIKNVLFDIKIIGVARFSYFYGTQIEKHKNYLLQATKLKKAISYNLEQKSYQNYEDDDLYTHNLQQQQQQQIQIKSLVESLNESEFQSNLMNLQKLYETQNNHSPYNKTKLFLFIIIILFLVTKITVIAFDQYFKQEIIELINVYVSSSYLALQLKVLYHASLFAYIKNQTQSFSVLSEVISTGQSLNKKISNNLLKFEQNILTKDFFRVSKYAYLTKHENFNLNQVDETYVWNISILGSSKLYQNFFVQTFSGVSNTQSNFTNLQLNYPNIKNINIAISQFYSNQINRIIISDFIINIFFFILRVLIYITVIYVIQKFIFISNYWIQEAIDAISMISQEYSEGYKNYYKQFLKQTKETTLQISNQLLQIEIQQYVGNITKNYRGNNYVKGAVLRWKTYPFIIIVLIFSLLELNLINQFIMIKNFQLQAEFNTQLLASQNILVESSIALKESYIYNNISLNQFTQQYHQNYTAYINILQNSFLLYPSDSFQNDTVKILTDNICDTLSNGNVNITDSKCSQNLINTFGLLMVIEGVAQSTYKSYKRLSTNLTEFKQYTKTSTFDNFQFLIFYILNGWEMVWDNISEQILEISISQQLIENIFNIINVFCCFVLGIGAYLFAQKIRKSIKHIYGYYLILPRCIIRENMYAKRFVQRFLKFSS